MSGPVARDLGCKPLPNVWEDMKRFTQERTGETRDEVWFVEHPPVFTLGLNADPTHVLDAGDIPVIKIDRGGQVTYHGPGQLVCYLLLDLARAKMSVRGVVEALEAAVVQTLAGYGVEAYGRREAPGVYVGERKIAAVGLRIRRHCSYHGIALNVAMDLSPFWRINPCGFSGLDVTQVSDVSPVTAIERVRQDLEQQLRARLE